MRHFAVFLGFLLLGASPILHSTTVSALPADFTGQYQILQRRLLALTNGHGYVLQDGSLTALSDIQTARAYCHGNLSSFDDDDGAITVHFEALAGRSQERALLQTVPNHPAARVLTIECIADQGFTSGILDLSIALGRIVDIKR